MDERLVVMEQDDAQVTALADEADVPLIVARVLINRGITTAEQYLDFISPSTDALHDPFLLPDMEIAASRLAKAVKEKEHICVHGDYDADGVTSTAILVRMLRALGANVRYHLPHRKRGGYDLKIATVEELEGLGVTLIVTCDCGISASEAIGRASELGIDVIVTDHHEPGEALPTAHAVVNPKRADSNYPFRELAGVGVAYKLAQGVVRLLDANEESFKSRFMDLVALGTIADVVPLVGENRIFVKQGLLDIPKTKKLGLQTLLRATNIIQKPAGVYHVGFVLAPRINAVGRMDDAAKALDLLLTVDEKEAGELMTEIEIHNSNRKIVQQNIIQEAIEQVQSKDLSSTHVLVLAAEGWNTGVVGLAAGRIAEEYSRPAILLSIDPESGMATGSGRSVPAFHLLDGVRHCADHLSRSGGHAAAVGLTMPASGIAAFEECINGYAASLASIDDFIPKITLDAEIDASDLTVSLAQSVATLEPFGAGNAEPLFLSRNLSVVSKQRVGDGSHFKMQIKGKNTNPIDCIGFGLGDYDDIVELGGEIDLCYNIRLNTFNGASTLQLAIQEIL